LIDTAALRKSIIDLATSGQLSSICDGDDSIRKILAQLPVVSTKKKKLLAQEYEYDELFSIPKHWKWMKLGEISSYGDAATKIMAIDVTDNTWILELEDIEAGGRLLVKKRADSRKSIGEKTVFKKGQVLYSKLRPYLKKVLVADENGISTPELISFDLYADINANYIKYCLTNSYVDRVINKRSYGIKMPRVDAGFMVNLPIPVPPIQEQDRIVKLVENIMDEINCIDEAQKKYTNDIEILIAKLIDSGIQGKLTEQLSEDGNAADLYEEIRAEKAKLVKACKIKKEKALPEITEDEIPFDIPPNWKWVRLGEISWFQGGYAFKSNLYVEDSDNQVIRLGNVKQNVLLVDARPVFISDELAKEVEDYRIRENDILITMTGTRRKKDYFYAKCVEQSDLQGKKLYLNQRVGCIRVVDGVYPQFLVIALQNTEIRKIIFERETGAVNQGNLGSEDIKKFVYIPLPPYAEQIRIVEKIREVISCGQIMHLK
jgi:type I restriction enzyme S subunit